jgi:hypothetical protein
MKHLIPAAVAVALVACGGGSSTAPIQPPTPTAYTWTLAHEHAAYAGRDGAGVVVLNNVAYMLGGWRTVNEAQSTPTFPETGDWGCCTTSEVWRSTDGATWTRIAVAPWEGRHMSGWVAFNGKLWVLGGDSNHGHYQLDAWSSPDGLHWTQEANDLPWGHRVLHYAVAYNSYVYVMGGQQLPEAITPAPSPYPTEPVYYSDVWRSSDGAHWTQVGSLPAATGMICGSVVFNGAIWVVGGGQYGDDSLGTSGIALNSVWSSTDGVNWTVHAPAPWSGKRYHNVLVFNGELWVLAGMGKDGGGYSNEVWHSADGETWTQLQGTPWSPRHAASAFVLDSALWFTDGTDDGGIEDNDIWQLAVQP